MTDKDNEILKADMDAEELKQTNGGWADGPGSCTGNYYIERCKATVEKRSNCFGTDFCHVINTIYHCTEHANVVDSYDS